MHPPWLIELDTCPSTNTWALERIAALAPGAAVWTRRQTAGRGRTGGWTSPPGVLTASVVVDPVRPVADAQLALLAGLAVCHACEDLVPGLRAGIKWPNDVLVGGRKLAGILIERAPGGTAVVGIGLNIDPRWEGQAPMRDGRLPAVLAEHGPAPDPVAVLALLRRYLLEGAGLAAAGGWNSLLAQVRQRDALAGRRIQVEQHAAMETGLAQGIDADGALLFQTDVGVHPIITGHVTQVQDDQGR